MAEAWPKPMSIVEVDWIDSCDASGWQSAEDAMNMLKDGCHKCRTTGYLFHEDEQQIAIVQSIGVTGNVDSMQSIPRVAITAMTMVRKVRKR